MPAGAYATPHRRRVGDELYVAIHERIMTGQLPLGARLSVPALAQEYEVSRSPVREAVIRLVHEGLARETVNLGAVVATPDLRELMSLYEAREALEWAAARLATEHYTPALRQRLLAILTEHEQVAKDGDFPRHVSLDASFHRELRQAAESPVLERMLDGIQDKIVLAMRSTSLTGGMTRAVADHRAIFEAVTSLDQDAAAEAARAHIHRLKELLREREH